MASTVKIQPSLGTGLLLSQVGPPLGYDAIDERRRMPDLGEGVATYNSFRVSQRGAGANMSVDVAMDDRAWIRGGSVAVQGCYVVSPHASTINLDIAPAEPINPRVDTIVLEAADAQHDFAGLNGAHVTAAQTSGSFAPNVMLRSASGATTAPTTTDVAGLTTATDIPGVPFVTLSVG